ncbi:MAG TPA: TetR/AcrR family transcriptional regulator [Halothiobacillaceae bacterium]|nr:TetR/AcrR family transcriptional regulator [Halothiobacillaceae bacterium]
MPRKPSFERDEVLEQAMDLFWSRGYNRTSMRDLKDATRLNPGSLYAAFENKQGVFTESLGLYSRGLRREVESLLGGNDAPLDRIRRFFDNLVEGSHQDKESRGCLLVNTLIEAPADEPEIRAQAGEALQYVERRFETLIAEGQRDGSIQSQRPAATLARTLMTGIFGMRVYSRMPDGLDHIREIVNTLIDGTLAPRTN